MDNTQVWKNINTNIVKLNKWTQRLMYTAQTSQCPILDKQEDLDALDRRIFDAAFEVAKI